MKDKTVNSATGRKIELIIRKINTLSALPGTLAKLLPLLKGSRLAIERLEEIIQSDPALTANILSLANKQNYGSVYRVFNVRDALGNLDEKVIRESIMSTRIYQPPQEGGNLKIAKRKELIRFSLATACCAEEVGMILLDEKDRSAAFSGGLLHSIGKFAIEQALPKSCEKISEEARLLGESDISTEKKYLGIDHTVIGKRIADKWKLPVEIGESMWLYRSDIEAISTAVSDSHPAVAVALGYLIAREAQIGDSGSYEPVLSAEIFGRSVDISKQQIEEIKNSLDEKVDGHIQHLGLEIEQPEQIYSQAVWELASNLAKDNSSLTEQNIELTTNMGISEFANNFLPSVGCNSTPLEIADLFAKHWQKYYQTGPVCVYLCREGDDDLIDAVVADVNGDSSVELLSYGGDVELVPEKINGKFDIIDADEESFGWLYDQLDNSLNSLKAKAVPILSSSRTVAVILWQYNYLPQDREHLLSLAGPANIAGPVIELAYAYENQQRIAEQFASLLGRLGNIKEKLSRTENLEGLAEMAAGAAHELNNPITVVSGRLQMLIDQERTQAKKESLELIKERVEDISNIVSDLMSFARPDEPNLRTISPAVLVDSAIDDVRQKYDKGDIEANIENLDSLRDIYVDADQIREALGHIICNGYESYHNTGKQVKISGAEQNQYFVRLQITDFGSGMDSETLSRARQPFFSGKPAGRKRGMGLAHAQRLLNVNKASLHITSQPGKGTTVTVLLPCQES